MFVGSFGAALGLYAAAFIGVHDDIDPFLRDIHQQSEWAAWAAAAACIAAVFSAIERLGVLRESGYQQGLGGKAGYGSRRRLFLARCYFGRWDCG
jgi:hypothetical protein